jgi:hypothetical protein
MSDKYRYDHRSHKNKKRHLFLVILISSVVVIALAITVLILIDQTTKKIKTVNGPNELVGQITANPTNQVKTVQEPTYSFSLPQFWRQTAVVSDKVQNSITWQSFEKDATNRYLTIYTDPLPLTFPVNRELPLEAHGATLSFGSLSGNCADFTNTNTTATRPLIPILAKWENVTFWCNAPSSVDNQVGTGTVGAINSVTLTGELTGTSHFFFLYIDRNNTPDYSIFYQILNSFQAK